MAWAKLLFLRDRGDTEVGGFGITPSDDPLLIEDVQLVRQHCTSVTVSFDDEAVADYFDAQIDAGLRPEQFGRIWIHTHPGTSAAPSSTDETTFARVFGRCDWAVMFIIAQGGQTYARLQFSAGPGGELRIPVEVDFSSAFAAADHAAWQAAYDACVVGDHGLHAESGTRGWILSRKSSPPVQNDASQLRDLADADCAPTQISPSEFFQ